MRFKKRITGNNPQVSTASLPDIVFMLLFFFMVTTVMREEQLKLKIEQPDASETMEVKNKSLTATIFIGPPLDSRLGDVERIQIDNELVTLNKVGQYIEAKRQLLPDALQPKFMTIIKAHKEAEMGIITQVKQELRKINALKVQYAALKDDVLTQ